jgi:hypothetical protein
MRCERKGEPDSVTAVRYSMKYHPRVLCCGEELRSARRFSTIAILILQVLAPQLSMKTILKLQ